MLPDNSDIANCTKQAQTNHHHLDTRLSQTGMSSALNLAQRTTAADKRDRARCSYSREELEQVPGGIVEEEEPLDRDQRSEEDDVRDGSRFQRGREVIDVRAEEKPL